MLCKALVGVVLSLASLVNSHYTFPSLLVNGASTGDWVNVRRTDNYNSNGPITDVSSTNFRCYNQGGAASSSTARVSAGSRIGFQANQGVYHQSVTNIYMAKAPGNVSQWDGSGNVWFRVHEIPAVTNGGSSISFPAQNVQRYEFTLPSSLPAGQYLVRVENIAIHGASSFGGAQFYISCAQIEVTGGGSGNPGPLVAIPGVYTGRESGIMLNIYYPVPATYTMPGPALWRG
ncbi:endoglucanase II [Coprinellus micaceus]|uniref:lytic cellulose monooxygenase (C4-dehydrogenating) n=1 Tax=Coprinellus micaceus TaxID=71717 RepID=A0A4Y7TWP4_COPMI|nr:endoglucanase II [Coprinellus micaceus]